MNYVSQVKKCNNLKEDLSKTSQQIKDLEKQLRELKQHKVVLQNNIYRLENGKEMETEKEHL